MARSFELVDYKVREAEYFLDALTAGSNASHFGGIQFCASAFAAAARSITFAMQSSMHGIAGFEEWYADRRTELKADQLARFFHEFRRVTQHIGDWVVGAGLLVDGRTLYYFVPSSDIPSVPDLDVVSACTAYFCTLLELVYRCYMDFGAVVDAKLYFTAHNFEGMGLGIEDAEEQLGFPRGFTHTGDPMAEPYRWETLRAQVNGCSLQSEFQRWLGKTVAWPERLPPYQPGA